MEKANIFVMILTIILAVGLIAVVYAKPQVVTVGAGAELNTLDVSAEGKASAEPSLADIFISVETKASTADAAQSVNADTVTKLRLALVGGGSVKEVTTTSFNVYPDYTYDYNTGRSTSNGYRVTHGLKVASENVAAVGKIVDVATANGASTIDYVQFRLSDDKTEQLKQQAIASAASKAREKAKNLATASGVTLGKPMKVTESSYYYPSLPSYYGAEMLAMDSKSSSSQVVPGEIDVTATVSISYAIS